MAKVIKLKEAPVGSVVMIYLTHAIGTNDLTLSPEPTSVVTSALVLSRDVRDNVLLTWKNGQMRPIEAKPLMSSIYDYGALYSGNCACLVDDVPSFPETPIELPCRQCSKKNECTRTRCWWCIVSEPTNHSKIGP